MIPPQDNITDNYRENQPPVQGTIEDILDDDAYEEATKKFSKKPFPLYENHWILIKKPTQPPWWWNLLMGIFLTLFFGLLFANYRNLEAGEYSFIYTGMFLSILLFSIIILTALLTSLAWLWREFKESKEIRKRIEEFFHVLQRN